MGIAGVDLFDHTGTKPIRTQSIILRAVAHLPHIVIAPCPNFASGGKDHTPIFKTYCRSYRRQAIYLRRDKLVFARAVAKSSPIIATPDP